MADGNDIHQRAQQAMLSRLKQEAGIDPSVRDGLAEAVASMPPEYATSFTTALEKVLAAKPQSAAADASGGEGKRSADIRALADTLVKGIEDAGLYGADLSRFAEPVAKIANGKQTLDEVKASFDTWKLAEGEIAQAAPLLVNLFPSVFPGDKEKLAHGKALESDAKESLRRSLAEGLSSAISPLPTPDTGVASESAKRKPGDLPPH